MSKEEYSDEVKRYALYYHKGKQEERSRVLKAIDEKIKERQPNGSEAWDYLGIKALKQLKLEVEKYE